MKRCPRCREDKFASAFYVTPQQADGLSSYCRDCNKAYHRARTARLKREHLGDGSHCANPACRALDDLIVDHDHTTGAKRGILCRKCNVALGMLNDEVARIEGLATYLTVASGR
jgi:phage FluMu protein Com